MRAIGIAIPFFRRRSGVDAQAQVHYNRVIADGGVVPSGLSGVNAFFSAVKAIYGTSDINTAISAAYDAHYLGYKLGAGSGTTLGQAAQKLYAPKGIFGGIGTGSAFYDSVGVTSNFINTPSIGIDTNSGMSVDVKVALVSGVTYTSNWICSNDNGSTNRNMFLGFTSPNRTLIVYWSNLTRFASSTIALSDGFDGWIRCSLETSGSDMLVRFFTSLDGITYTQLGTTVTNSGGANTFQTSNAPFNITGNGGANIVTGKIYRVIYRNASGVVRADFNANQYTGANTWTSTTSEVWTVNSTGAGLADVVQTTAASQPLLLAHTGENYWFGSGVSGNYCSCTSITINYTALDFRALVTHYDTTLSATATVISQDTNTLQIFNTSTTTCVLVINWKDGLGTSRFRTSSSLLISSLANLYIRATVEQVGIDQIAKFYTSTDGITYTLFSTAASIVTTGFLSVTFSPNVGAFSNGSGTSKIKVSRATISNSIGGAPVVDFNPASYNPATSQTQWTSTTGEVWSLNVGTAATGYKSAIVTKSIVQGDGIDDFLLSGTLAIRQYFTSYLASNPLTLSSGTDGFYGSTNSNHVLYEDSGIVGAFNLATLNYSGALSNRLALYTTNFNSASSLGLINNTNQVNASTGAGTSTNVQLFLYSTGLYFGNNIINTLIQSVAVDNSTQRTAMYNALRGFDGNAY